MGGLGGSVLVTGGSGALGRQLVALLVRRASGRVVSWTGPAAEAAGAAAPADGVETVAVDLRDAEAVTRAIAASRPSVVFHLAGTRSGGLAAMADLNVLGFARLADAIEAAGIEPLVVVAGSSAQYGLRADTAPIAEGDPSRPGGAYGATKSAQEELVRACAGRFPTVALRLFNLVGPGQRRGLLPADLAYQLVDPGNAAVRVGPLHGSRDFVDYRDAAAALVAVAELQPGEAVFNVATGAATPLRELVRQLIEVSGRDVACLEEAPGAQPPHGLAHQCGNAAALVRATGWQPIVPLRRSLRDLIEHAAEATAGPRLRSG